jgi:membrane associated rhomboid family serine protease
MFSGVVDYYQHPDEPQRQPPCPATIALLVINGVIWLLQSWAFKFHGGAAMEDYFALSLPGLQHGYLWQLLTFQFMHAVPWPWHLLANSWAIFIFGRIVEPTIGWRRMLTVYFLSGVVGGLVQMLGAWLVPALFGDSGVVGASAGAFGLVASFAVLYPEEVLYLLLFFIIPLKMRATTLLWFFVGIAVFGIFYPLFAAFLPPTLGISGFMDDFFGNVAHAAHLGGIVTGFLFTRLLIQKHRRIPPIIHAPPKTSLNITPASD